MKKTAILTLSIFFLLLFFSSLIYAGVSIGEREKEGKSVMEKCNLLIKEGKVLKECKIQDKKDLFNKGREL